MPHLDRIQRNLTQTNISLKGSRTLKSIKQSATDTAFADISERPLSMKSLHPFRLT